MFLPATRHARRRIWGREEVDVKVGKDPTDSSNGSKDKIPRVSSAHFHRTMEEWKRLIRHYQPLAQFWCQVWCQIRAIFPVFTDFTGSFAFYRQ